jgi:MFS family permease
MTFFSPITGRMLDRIGLEKGIPMLLIASSMCLLSLGAVSTLKTNSMIILFLTILAGITGSGASSGMRVLLNKVIPKRLIPSALALDATIVEIVVVSAPLVAAIAAIPAPSGAVLAMGIATLLSTIPALQLLKSTKNKNKIEINQKISIDSKPSIRSKVASRTLWKNPRFVFWIILSVAFGHILGTAETGALPISESLGGGTGNAAALIAVLSICSALSGVTYATFSHKLTLSPIGRAYILISMLIIGCSGLSFSNQWILTILSLIVIGISTAPLFTVRSHAVEAEIPENRKAEGFGLINSTHSLGFAMGGLFLAVTSLNWMLLAGAISGLIVMMLAPFLMHRSAAKDRKHENLQI